MKVGFEITARSDNAATAKFSLIGEGAPYEKIVDFNPKQWHDFDISLQAACPFPNFKRHLVDAGIPDRPASVPFYFTWTSAGAGFMEIVDSAIYPAPVP